MASVERGRAWVEVPNITINYTAEAGNHKYIVDILHHLKGDPTLLVEAWYSLWTPEALPSHFFRQFFSSADSSGVLKSQQTSMHW